MPGKKKVKVFISYARKNKKLAVSFLDKFYDQVKPSKRYKYSFWRDSHILVGEDWHKTIKKAIRESDLGLLLISPAFLGSKYIKKHELKSFVGKNATPVIPIMLQPVDLKRHNLKGLKKKQIFRLDRETFKNPKAYAECTGSNQRDPFAHELFKQVEYQLDKLYKAKNASKSNPKFQL